MTEFVFNGVKVTEEEFEELIESSHRRMVMDAETLEKAYVISRETADAIVYLRTRSRWTELKEWELIDRDRAGNPIPLMDVLSGEF